MRIFIPPTLHRLYVELNNSNKVLTKQVELYGLDGVQLIYAKGIRPTRTNVVDKEYLNFIAGGVNFFPNNPIQEFTEKIDEMLSEFSSENTIVPITLIENLLLYVGSYNSEDWDNQKFSNCVKSLSLKRPSIVCSLILRRDRDISKGTGTLLSPTDRKLGDTLQDNIVLTLYRINGQKEKGWNGHPFWIPNIKFPSNSCFYDIIK